MRKMIACMLGAAALCFSMAGAETPVSAAEKASSPCRRMAWNRGWEFRLEDEPGKSGWQTAHLPHTFSLPYFMSDSFYTGRGRRNGWGRRFFWIAAQPSRWRR